MENLTQETDGSFHVVGGADILFAIVEAGDIAREKGCCVTFNFNGVTITVCPDSIVGHIFQAWLLRKNDTNSIGPYPKRTLKKILIIRR